MRRTEMIAATILATVAAGAAHAQATTRLCRSGSLSELAACATALTEQAEAAAEAEPEADDAETLAPLGVQPSRLGGALQPSDLRAGPAPVAGPVAPRRTNEAPVADTARAGGPIRSYTPYGPAGARSALRQPMTPTR